MNNYVLWSMAAWQCILECNAAAERNTKRQSTLCLLRLNADTIRDTRGPGIWFLFYLALINAKYSTLPIHSISGQPIELHYIKNSRSGCPQWQPLGWKAWSKIPLGLKQALHHSCLRDSSLWRLGQLLQIFSYGYAVTTSAWSSLIQCWTNTMDPP